MLTFFSSADLRERQTHHTGSERHRIQLRRHRKHIQSDVQGACGNLTQCQLHCMCHLKGQSELWNLKYVWKCINEPRLASTFRLLFFFFSHLRARTPITAQKGWRKWPRNRQRGPRRRFSFLAHLEITTVRQWRTARYQRSSTTPELNTVSCRYTEPGTPQTAGKTGLLEIYVVPHDPSE